MTPLDFMQKMDWEGGDLQSVFEYGLGANDLDDSDPEFNQLVHAAEVHYRGFEREANNFHEKYGYSEEYLENAAMEQEE